MNRARSIAGILALTLTMPATGAIAQETKTSKERLSRKWFDEQRIDNCRVPVELHGAAPRPGCHDEPGTASAARTDVQPR
jgi:hypothetical protein